MYVNWLHHYLPKIAAVLSVFINFFFIYILRDDKKVKLGNYRYLLLFFALYNLIVTAGDVLVPMCIHDHRYAFSVFISEGIFKKSSEHGKLAICLRCSLVPASYAVLHSHFIYRFLALFASKFIKKWFLPYGLIFTVVYSLFMMSVWFVASYYFLFADMERRIYMEKPLRDLYDLDVYDLNIMIALYNEGSSEAVNNSWIGIILMSVSSIDSVLLYFILGALIIIKLNSSQLLISDSTLKMQRQLMKALVIQAAIPIFVNFLPCLFSWYQPCFALDYGRWIYVWSMIAISLFPVLDPCALFYFIPTFRRRIREVFGIKKNQECAARSVELTRSSKLT